MEQNESNPNERKTRSAGTRAQRPDLKDPRLVLSLLEADQVVAAKATRFGRRNLSFGPRLALWGLRVYVLFMMVIVAISIVQAIHGVH